MSERRFVSEIGIANQRERRVSENDPAPLLIKCEKL